MSSSFIADQLRIFVSEATHTLAEGDFQENEEFLINIDSNGFMEVAYVAWEVCAYVPLPVMCDAPASLSNETSESAEIPQSDADDVHAAPSWQT